MCAIFLYGPLLLLVFTILLYQVIKSILELFKIRDLQRKAVLITGCDSGFGYALAVKLVGRGQPVFAACYTEAGERQLQKECAQIEGASRIIKTFRLDVTSDKSVADAVEFVKSNLQNDHILWAVVNNAGAFTVFGPDAWLTIDDYKQSLEVNFFGALRVSQAFVPLLKRSRGRIVTMISVSGRVSWLFMGPYAAAKFALEGYMDVLRLELHQFGVSVHILEPGAFRTGFLCFDAFYERVDKAWERLSDQLKGEYGTDYRDLYKHRYRQGVMMLASKNTSHVINDYYHAVTARFPRLRYYCGWDSKFLWIPLSLLPTRVQDAALRLLVFLQPAPPLIPAVLKSSDGGEVGRSCDIRVTAESDICSNGV